ncbi:MAG: hypothetical protein IMY73_02290 [Bacteroidetes bacterium]|nr:hypothetical protein [Bacteroidota bacterium]
MNIVINKKEYAWGDINVVLFGQPVLGIRAIEYKSEKAKEALYGAGRNALGIQHGKYTHSGSLTLLSSEIEGLNRSAISAGYKSILDIEFDIVVSYMSLDGAVSVDTIKKASITELPKGMKEGDMFSEHALPFICLDINLGM